MGRLDVVSYQISDDGDGVDLWNASQLTQPYVAISPTSFYWIKNINKFISKLGKIIGNFTY